MFFFQCSNGLLNEYNDENKNHLKNREMISSEFITQTSQSFIISRGNHKYQVNQAIKTYQNIKPIEQKSPIKKIKKDTKQKQNQQKIILSAMGTSLLPIINKS